MTPIEDILWDLAAHSPLLTKGICSRGTACVFGVVLSVAVGLTTVGKLVGSPQRGWMPGPALCSGSRHAGRQGCVLVQLAVHLRGPRVGASPLVGGFMS